MSMRLIARNGNGRNTAARLPALPSTRFAEASGLELVDRSVGIDDKARIRRKRSAGDSISRQSIGLLAPVSRWWRSSHLPSTSRLIM
jgi:hypothetical protein